jgi:hypothetical protein
VTPEERKTALEVYAALAPIPDQLVAQRRCDELWTKTVNVISATGLRFIARSEVGEKHTLVDVGRYRVDVRKPTHGSLEAAVWPSLGQAILRDAGFQRVPRPREVLPIETLRVLEWTPKMCVVTATLYFFDVDAPRIVVAQEVPAP